MGRWTRTGSRRGVAARRRCGWSRRRRVTRGASTTPPTPPRRARAPRLRARARAGEETRLRGARVRTTRAAVGAGGAVTISAPRGDARKDLGFWGATPRLSARWRSRRARRRCDEIVARGDEGDEGDRDRGDLALVRAFNASVHPLHLPTLASLYASPSADVRAAARSLLSNACNACAGRPAHALPAIFRETPSEALRECPKASGLEAWGAFEDAFDDNAGLEVFRDPLEGRRLFPARAPGMPGRVRRRGGVPREPPSRDAPHAPRARGSRASRADAIVRARLPRGRGGFDARRGCRKDRVGDRRAGREVFGGDAARGVRYGGGAREPEWDRTEGDEPEPETERYGRHGRHEPEDERPIAARIRRLDRSPFPALPGLSRRFESFAILGRSREGVGRVSSSAPRRHPVGTPAERATARDAIDSLLFAAARSRPASFAKFLSARIQTAPPTSSSHVVALAALARVARESPHPRELLAPHVHALMNAVLAALNPANASLRRNCLVAATAVVAELARGLPNVTYHRATSRLAVGIDSPAPSGGTVAIVYDLARRRHVAHARRPGRSPRGGGEAVDRRLRRRVRAHVGDGVGNHRSPPDKPSRREPSTDERVHGTDGWTNTFKGRLGSRAEDQREDGRVRGRAKGGEAGDGGRRSSGGDGGAFVSDSPTSPEARTARAHAAMAAIPVPETPEQRYAAAAAAAATAMTAHRADPPRKSFEGSRRSFQSTSTPPPTPRHAHRRRRLRADRGHGVGRERGAARGVPGPALRRSRLERGVEFCLATDESVHPGHTRGGARRGRERRWDTRTASGASCRVRRAAVRTKTTMRGSRGNERVWRGGTTRR